MEQFRGSAWSKWDLQVQTILDDNYVTLADYADQLKEENPTKWQEFVNKVGTEDDVKLFDSRDYFFSGQGSELIRCGNYAKTLFSFLDVYNPNLKCIAITDHNHIHSALLNALVKESEFHECKVIAGVEINVDGIHVLALFPNPPCSRPDFSSGIQTFLAQLGVTVTKTAGVYTIVNRRSVIDVIDKISQENGMCIFAHCNSENGLLQEKTKTDRTVLASIFNHKSPIILQSRSLSKMEKTSQYIQGNNNLKSQHICTIGSDARSLKEIGKPDDKGNCLFVKGLLTFEGLRQACFEPATRIHIGHDEPVNPVHRIDSVKVSFPTKAQLGDDTFCLAGEFKFPLSPNLTCLIGGRGTGKSTILNLIDEKLRPHENTFFSKREVKSDNKKVKIDSAVQLDLGSEGQDVDFLSQNEIEKFATDAQALTKSLYARLEKHADGKLGLSREALEEELKSFDKHILNITEDNELLRQIDHKKSRKESLAKVIASFKSKTYLEISGKISESSQIHSAFKSAQDHFHEMVESIEGILENYELEEDEEANNEYVIAICKVAGHLKAALREASALDENSLEKKMGKFEKAIETNQKELASYLKKRGVTEENQNDVSKATQEIAQIDEEIKALERKRIGVEKSISKYDISTLETKKTAYEKALRDTIKEVNAGLTNLSAEVKPIKLEYGFDEEKCVSQIYEDFKDFFQINPARHGTHDNHLFEVLLKGDPLHLINKDDFIEKLYAKGKKKELSAAENLLIVNLEDNLQFKLFELIVKRNLLDPISMKVINVYYDEKLLAKTSFGQRCTAALVLLILLGNNPIIIDEPEGHLDSLLIANYLVDLIKKAKLNRQIVFATHNANLVVNGDADLIYHLEMDPTGLTIHTPTVLEDVSNRHRIISLEGGAEAFKRREGKYLVHKPQ